MNPDIKRYLDRATKGLWGKKRLEVKEELSAHIEARVTAHRIAGLSEADATKLSLDELGHPKEVNNEMFKLYTLPTALGSSLLLLAALALSVVLLSNSVAQTVTGTFYLPTESCLEGEDCAIQTSQLWLDTASLQAALEPQGLKVKQNQDSVTLTLPDGKRVFIQTTDQWFEDNRLVTREKGFISLWDILARVAEVAPETTVVVSGWDEPGVTLGKAKLKVTTDKQPIGGESFYQAYLEALVGDALSERAFYGGSVILGSSERAETKALSVHISDATPGVYGLAIMANPRDVGEGPLTTMSFEIVQVGEDGMGNFNTPSLATEPRFMTQLPDTPELGAALLIRLAGGVNGNWYEVVSPEQIRLE